MKNLMLLLVAFFVCATMVNAQQVTFEKWYDYGFAEAGYCVQQTPDSGYIIAGRQGIWFFSAKMLFIKTDKYGNTEWTTLVMEAMKCMLIILLTAPQEAMQQLVILPGKAL
jgi:hypothetical protein